MSIPTPEELQDARDLMTETLVDQATIARNVNEGVEVAPGFEAEPEYQTVGTIPVRGPVPAGTQSSISGVQGSTEWEYVYRQIRFICAVGANIRPNDRVTEFVDVLGNEIGRAPWNVDAIIPRSTHWLVVASEVS